MSVPMKLRYRLFRKKSGIFFLEDRLSRKQESLKTRDKTEATRMLHARNEAHQQPAINLQIARAYLMASDPLVAKRTWQHVAETMTQTKQGPTRDRYERAVRDKAFGRIRNVRLIETQAEHFLGTLAEGTVSTNVFLRKVHNFALDMNWLACPVIPRKQWPAVVFGEKRAITLDEHLRIIEAEGNRERKAFYQLCWHLGASQGDIANLKGEDVDWTNNTVSFFRKKTGAPVVVHLGGEALNLFKDLPSEGALFPYLCTVRSGDRATEFKQRCKLLKIEGVTLHSYRYAWAERARVAGYPERFAMENLGHNSKAVHHAYAKHAQVKIPSLEDYEKAQATKAAAAQKMNASES
jgi:integrase